MTSQRLALLRERAAEKRAAYEQLLAEGYIEAEETLSDEDRDFREAMMALQWEALYNL